MPPVLMLRPEVGGGGCITPTPYFLIYAVLDLARNEHSLVKRINNSTLLHSKEVLFAHSYFFSSQENLQLACTATNGFQWECKRIASATRKS